MDDDSCSSVDPLTGVCIYETARRQGKLSLCCGEYGMLQDRHDDGRIDSPHALSEAEAALYSQESSARDSILSRHLSGRSIDFANRHRTTLNCSFFGPQVQLQLEHVSVFSRTLTVLKCGHNEMTGELPPAIGSLTLLRELICNDNFLTSLPAEIGNLKNLMVFRCEYNTLTSLPIELGQLSNLEEFDCGDNRLTRLPKELGRLRKLRILNCINNELKALPMEFRHLTNLESNRYCSFGGNPLFSPPLNVALRGGPAVVGYFLDLHNGAATMDVQRIMFVGAGGVGKSSTTEAVLRNPGSDCTYLRNQPYDSTRGIKVRFWRVADGKDDACDGEAASTTAPTKNEWYEGALVGQTRKNEYGNRGRQKPSGPGARKGTARGRGRKKRAQKGKPKASVRVTPMVPKIKFLYVRLWDLAGQLEYYVTHALLLGDAATIYIIVVSLTRITRPLGTPEDEEFVDLGEQLGLWLRFLRLLQMRGDFQHSTVVVVGTHVDQLEEELRQQFGDNAPDAAAEGLSMLARELRALPDELLPKNLLCDVDLDADNNSAANLQLLDLRSSPAATERIDKMRERLGEAVRSSSDEAEEVPATYVRLIGVIEDLRREREVKTDEESTADSGGGAPNSQGSNTGSSGFGKVGGYISRLLGWVADENTGIDSVSYLLPPVVPLESLLEKSRPIFGDDLAQFSRALRFLEASGTILLCGRIDEALSPTMDQLDLDLSDCFVFLDVQWVSMLASLFLAPPKYCTNCQKNAEADCTSCAMSTTTPRPLGGRKGGNNPAILTFTEVEARLSPVTRSQPRASEIRLIMRAMEQLDLCNFNDVRNEYLFPSMLQPLTPEARLEVLPPGHRDARKRAPCSIARVITFGQNPKISMVPPGLFSRLQTALLRLAGSERATLARVHKGLIRVVLGETTVWAFELTSRLQIAIAVSSKGADTALPRMAEILSTVSHLSRNFPGMSSPQEHACCVSCLSDFFFSVNTRPHIYYCGPCGGCVRDDDVCAGERHSSNPHDENIWPSAFDRNASKSCLGVDDAGLPLSLSLCQLLTGRIVPKEIDDLRKLQVLVLNHVALPPRVSAELRRLCEAKVETCEPFDIGPGPSGDHGSIVCCDEHYSRSNALIDHDANDLHGHDKPILLDDGSVQSSDCAIRSEDGKEEAVPCDPPMFDVFLSHTTPDKKDVLCIHLMLEAQGFRTFYDLRSIESLVTEDISSGLQHSRHLLAWCSAAFFQSAWACRETWSFLRYRGAAAITPYAVGIKVANQAGGMPKLGPLVDSDLIPDVSKTHGEIPLGYAVMYTRAEKNVRVPGRLTGTLLQDVSAKLHGQLGEPGRVTLLSSLDVSRWMLVQVVGLVDVYETEYGELWNVPASRLETDTKVLRQEYLAKCHRGD